MARADTAVVDTLGKDIVAIAQAIALDASVFPYASADFVVQSHRSCTWVARDPTTSRVSAFLAARARRGELHVSGLAVDPAARRRGLARALLRACLASDLAKSCTAVVLHVSVTNRAAVALYESEGFAIARRLRDFYPARAYGAEGDAFEMRRSF
jgi:ribosomal protein S18 acetylase RimI-like enzyme